MSLRRDTINLMQQFARGVLHHGTRQGEEQCHQHPFALELYSDLIKNVYYTTLQKAYPIAHNYLRDIKSVHTTDAWQELIGEFMLSGKAHSPYLWRMPKSLINTQSVSNIASKYNIPWLNDLLLYEWAEIEVHRMKDQDPQVKGTFTKNQMLLHLKYPVQRRARPEGWSTEGDYFVSCFRQNITQQVKYIELDPLLVVCLESWLENPLTARDLKEIALLHGYECNVSDIQNTIDLLTKEGLIN